MNKGLIIFIVLVLVEIVVIGAEESHWVKLKEFSPKVSSNGGKEQTVEWGRPGSQVEDGGDLRVTVRVDKRVNIEYVGATGRLNGNWFYYPKAVRDPQAQEAIDTTCGIVKENLAAIKQAECQMQYAEAKEGQYGPRAESCEVALSPKVVKRQSVCWPSALFKKYSKWDKQRIITLTQLFNKARDAQSPEQWAAYQKEYEDACVATSDYFQNNFAQLALEAGEREDFSEDESEEELE